MTPGAQLPPRFHDVRAGDMEVLARILHDPNPIHLDPNAAAAAGLGPRVINQGPANLAYVLDMLAEAAPRHRVQALHCRFLGNVRAGDRVEAGGEVVAADGDVVRCETWLRTDDGTIVLRAEATLVGRALTGTRASSPSRK